jgi:hypothetical protein
VLLVVGAQARASVQDVSTILYGKGDSQIQFVVCFEGADPDLQTIELGPEILEFSWTARDAAGAVVGSDRSPAPGVRYHSFGTCRYGYVQAYDIRDLTPGATYAIDTEAVLTSPSGATRTLTDRLIVTTTGGCPIDAPVENPPRYTYLHAIVDDQNRVTQVHSIAPGTVLLPPWSATRYVPTYYGWPGKQYAGIGYIYDPETDNFAPPLPAGVELPEGELLRLAGMSGCDDAPGTEVDLVVAPASQDNCTAVDGGVQGFAPGPCAVELTIRRTARSTRTRTVTALAMVRGSASRPARPVPGRPARPTTPAPPTAAGGASAVGGTASAVAWTARADDRTATARFRAVRGTAYRIRAVRAGSPSRTGVCRVRAGSATCTISLDAEGRWRVSITPMVDGRAGRPIRARIVMQ